jgi:hypothetical protein
VGTPPAALHVLAQLLHLGPNALLPRPYRLNLPRHRIRPGCYSLQRFFRFRLTRSSVTRERRELALQRTNARAELEHGARHLKAPSVRLGLRLLQRRHELVPEIPCL